MKKVLIITNLFHSSPRIIGLAKFLPEFGFEITILTMPADNVFVNTLGELPEFFKKVEIIEAPYRGDIFWPWRKIFKLLGFNTKRSLLDQVKKQAGVVSKKSFIDYIFNLYRDIFGYPDDEKYWKTPAIKVASNLLKKEKFDAIISSSSPVTAHIIANVLKRKFNIPWIADLRDLWTQNHNYPFSGRRKKIEEKLEVKTFQIADFLVTVSPVWAEKMGHLHNSKKIYTITNGFLPEELNFPPLPLAKKFSIIYAGTLYAEKQDPRDFLIALKELISEGVINKDDIEIKFYSGGSFWLEKEIEEYGLRGLVNVFEKIPKQKIIEEQKKSQILLLFDWGDREEKGCYPLKSFGYLAIQRPILCFGAYGATVVEDLIKETKGGVYCKDILEIKNFLKNSYLEYKTKGAVSYGGDLTKINKYSYREMARKFADILNRLSK